MINTSLFFGAYVAPVCETAENLPEEFVCQSAGGVTEDYGDDVTFNW